jgi:ComF family protein
MSAKTPVREAFMLGKLFGPLLEMLFPPKCVFCGSLLRGHEKMICPDCRKTLPKPKQPLSQGGAYSVCAAALRYEGRVRKAFHRFKFGGKANYAKPFGQLMAATIGKELSGRYDVITWVPISRARKKKRGYDQSMLLAYTVALELNDVAVETLCKKVDNAAQSKINAPAQRQKNVKGVYEASEPALIQGKRILLIDDILTTGSTLSECAAVLLSAGATEVVCAVFAQSETGKNKIFNEM